MPNQLYGNAKNERERDARLKSILMRFKRETVVVINYSGFHAIEEPPLFCVTYSAVMPLKPALVNVPFTGERLSHRACGDLRPENTNKQQTIN